ncbi:MAG: MoaD/ThiS family protein, partial [Deltaproteobacteria bacterium]|nr:MoaD/ThiS family protein [Deltaproteobacteria bacterium]
KVPKVEVPPRYRGPTGGLGLIEVDADSVRSCIEAVETEHPGFRALILDGDGNLRRFVRLFVNGEALDRDAVDTPVADADHVQFLAAVAGG